MVESSKKSPLAIRLTEPAVFLRSDGTGRQSHSDSRPSMLRGLLTLDLTKSTRITSIELELVAKSVSAWPEGIGARRAEVTEEHKIYHASTVYFRASMRRTRRNASIGPGLAFQNTESVDHEWSRQQRHPDSPHQSDEAISREESTSHFSHDSIRRGRRLSADSSYFHPSVLSHAELSIPSTPPYSPPQSQPSSPVLERRALYLDVPNDGAFHQPEDRVSNHHGHEWAGWVPPQDLRQKLMMLVADPMTTLSPPPSASQSLTSSHQDISLSGRPSMDDVLEEETGFPSSYRASRSPSRPSTPGGGTTSSTEHRGRKVARFSLMSVSSVFKDVVRSRSPGHHHDGREPEGNEHFLRRGRSSEKNGTVHGSKASASRTKESKERSAFSRFGDILKLENQENAQDGEGWKEFKKGIYNYPISFAIPSYSPPTFQCNYGSVTWTLRATVHRPGTFKQKYVAIREVRVVSCPTEDDTEENENIIIERNWDQQLQYLISVSGRSFYIGGALPITLTFMPLAKVKIYRLSVFIEERVDYYTHMRRIARTDPITRIELVSAKEPGKHAPPLLPLESNDVDAFKKSPLFCLVGEDDDPSEIASSLMGPGPWSFHHNLRLPATCSNMHFTNRNRRANIVITHHLKIVIRVERGDDLHIDSKTGKRKLFDIVVQTPVHILSCRCNPDWTSLPRYSEIFYDPLATIHKCPCDARRSSEEPRTHGRTHLTLERMLSGQSSDSGTSVVEPSAVHPDSSLLSNDSIYSRSTRYERLISGQESEVGDAPPSYTDSLA